MTLLSPDALLTQLNWRYATKKFDATRSIPAEHWEALASAMVLSPSSYGLQPWHFINITSRDMRTKLTPATFNQPQVLDCSHFIVFTIVTDLDARLVDHFIERTAEVRKVPVDSLGGYRKGMMGDLVDGPRHAIINEWSGRQLYLALGTLLTSAAVMGIDACPMEGFDIGRYDEILGLKARGLSARACCALGYRSPNDAYATKPKVRFPRAEVLETIA